MDKTTTPNNAPVAPDSLATNPQSLTHRIMVFVLLFIFPPLAWFHMWKDHRYHKWFPYVLWGNGAILLGFSSFILTQLRLLLSNTIDTSMMLFVAHFLLLLFSFAEIGAGFYLKGICKDNLRLHTKALAIIILILLINTIAIPVSQFFFSMHAQKIAKSSIITVSPTPTPNPIADWKTYTNEKLQISFKYPPDWELLYEGLHAATFETPSQVLLSISNDPKDFIPLSSLRKCELVNEEDLKTSPCFNNQAWNKQNEIDAIFIDNKEAKSSYITYGVDSDRRIIQIDVLPKLQLSMFIAGGGLEDTFDKIISTFRFINATNPKASQTENNQVACTQEAKLCPDGSYAARTGPKCEFSPCPKNR